MFKISNIQLYCMLLLLVAPVAFYQQPQQLMPILSNNAWLAVFAGFLPGVLIVLMFSHIIKKSCRPFPLLLEEHLGKPFGKLLGFAYIPFFLLVASFTLRQFVDFLVSNVLPQTPISVFIGVLLFVGFIAVKSGLENIARVCEIVTLVGLPFSLFLAFMALIQKFNPENLLPFAYVNYKSFGTGIFYASYIYGKILPVLTLAYFCPRKSTIKKNLMAVSLTYVLVIGLTTLAIVMTLGSASGTLLAFPTSSMVRLLHIGEFIQNIDIIFMGIWILGVFASGSIIWFMACYIAQQVFGLNDYRFLAGPSSLIIGVGSIIISANISELTVMSQKILPVIYLVFFIIIPLFVFTITLFKPYPTENPADN